MREIMEEIKYFKVRRRGRVPNLWGANPVDRVEGGRSYAARMVGRGWPSQPRRGRGEASVQEDRSGRGLGRRERP